MTTTVITANLANPLDTDDRLAAKYHADVENAWRVEENARRATLTPPGTPLTIFPLTTAAERKTAYEAYLARILSTAHLSNIATAKEAQKERAEAKEIMAAYAIADDAKQAAILAAARA